MSSHQAGFNLIRFLARPITHVMEGGSPLAMAVGALMGGAAGAGGGLELRWPIFVCILVGMLVGAFAAAVVIRRPPPELPPDLPPEPGAALFELSWSHDEIVEVGAAHEHGLWGFYTDDEDQLRRCRDSLAAGAWPPQGVVVPWSLMTKVEQYTLDERRTAIFYDRRGNVRTLNLSHPSLESLERFGESLQRKLGWERRMAPEGLLSTVAAPLAVFVGVVLVMVALLFSARDPKEHENLVVLWVVCGVALLASLLWAAYRAWGERPKYIILEPAGGQATR